MYCESHPLKGGIYIKVKRKKRNGGIKPPLKGNKKKPIKQQSFKESY